MPEPTIDVSLYTIHQDTLMQLYSALQQAIRKSDAELISALSEAIRRII